jgi:hypothetical protein
MRVEKESAVEFWRKTALKRGGEIGLYTFATYLGRSGDAYLGLPGLMYTIGSSVWFEDFEKDNWLSSILGTRGKNYTKTEFEFSKLDVAFTRLVSFSNAVQCIKAGGEPDKVPAISALAKFFSTAVVEIAFTQGHCMFFEIMKREEMIGFLK